MMGARDDQRENGSSSCVCYGAGEPKAAAAERVSGRRKPDTPVSLAEAPAIDRSAEAFRHRWRRVPLKRPIAIES